MLAKASAVWTARNLLKRALLDHAIPAQYPARGIGQTTKAKINRERSKSAGGSGTGIFMRMTPIKSRTGNTAERSVANAMRPHGGASLIPLAALSLSEVAVSVLCPSPLLSNP